MSDDVPQYICSNLLHHSDAKQYYSLNRMVCLKCEQDRLKTGKSHQPYGLKKYCEECKKYISACNFSRPDRHKCFKKPSVLVDESSSIPLQSMDDTTRHENKYDYLKAFLQHVKDEVSQHQFVLWSGFKTKYIDLITSPIWNTTDLRNTITKNTLLGVDITFLLYDGMYYVCHRTVSAEFISAVVKSLVNMPAVGSGSDHSHNCSHTDVVHVKVDQSNSITQKECPGFTPSKFAKQYCSVHSCLVLMTGVIATQINSTDQYRSKWCKIFVTGKQQTCSMCSSAKKTLDQRGTRAQNAVDTGSIMGRNAYSTNTTALMLAKVNALQSSLYSANRKVKELQDEVDQLFHLNADGKDVDQKKQLFLKVCKALHQADGYPFFFQLYESQMDNFVKETRFLHRYDDTIKHFWKHFRHVAGPKAIDVLRGVQSENAGLEYNMFIPSNSTLDRIEDIGSYGAPPQLRVDEIHILLEDHAKQTGCKEYIISFDGIIVIPRYKYSEGLDKVLGGEVALTPEEYVSRSKEDLDDDLGNEVIQFLIHSIDGDVTIRAGHWVKPDKSNGVKFITSKLKTLVELFYKKDVCELIASCSDGDLCNDAVQSYMEKYMRDKYGTPWFHLFDFSHLLKALRNALLNRVLEPGGHQIHMNLLIDLCNKSPSDGVLSFIKDSWLNPPDIMKMLPCLEITSERVQTALKSLPEDMYSEQERSSALELSQYLGQIRSLYDCFMDVDMLQDKALTRLYGKSKPSETVTEDSLMSYICGWNASEKSAQFKLASQTSRHVTTTVNNLYKLVQYLNERQVLYKLVQYLNERQVSYYLKRSALSTLAVELTFCVTRGMQAYVTACEFSTLSGRSEWDQRIICTDPTIRRWSLPSDVQQPSKYYNACIIHYDTMPALKPKNDSKEKRLLHSDDVMKDMRLKLASQGETTGHKKTRSHCNTSHKKHWFQCGQCNRRPYHYPTALETHLGKVHKLSTEAAATVVKDMKVAIMKEIIAERSTERRQAAQNAGIREPAIEDGVVTEWTDEHELNLLDALARSHEEPTEESDKSISNAAGDNIFPISDELLDYVKDLEDIFQFVQMEITGKLSTTDLSQTEFALDQTKPVLVSFVDCETINLQKYPHGGPCEIAVRTEGMPPGTILCTRLNPFPLSTSFWSDDSISIHGITPEDVIGQPLLEKGIQAFYRLVTCDRRCRAICVAFNSAFDDSRITSCSELVPEFDEYDVVWVDARKLIGEEFVCDDEGRIIDRVGKLADIFNHRLKQVEQIDESKIHGARYDTHMMYSLLVHKYGSEEKVREEVIQLSRQRKGVGCNCTGGCVSCSCTVEGSAGCTLACDCFGCANPIQRRAAYDLLVTFEDLTETAINKMKKNGLKIMLHHRNYDIRGTKDDLKSRLLSVLKGSGDSVLKFGNKQPVITDDQELTREMVLKMSKDVLITQLSKRYNVSANKHSTVGALIYKLLQAAKLDQEGDEVMTAPRKKKRNAKSSKLSTQPSVSSKKRKSPPDKDSQQPTKKKVSTSKKRDADELDSSQASPQKRTKKHDAL